MPSSDSLVGRDFLGERARILGLPAPTSTSAGGASRLLATRDGWWALTLARPEDVELVPALVLDDVSDADPWEAIRSWSSAQPSAAVLERAHLLNLPAAAVPALTSPTVPAPTPPAADLTGLKVLDLSALWAGPLAASILLRLGAEVTKVESLARPDGARRGNLEFYWLLNEGKRELTIELPELADFVADADVVIESSRPRALQQVGIDAAELAEQHSICWVSITAYGRASNRVGFGDDVAAGAGLLRWLDGRPHFVGDAIADPLTGIAAAHAALSGPGLHEVSMHEVCLRQVNDAAA